MPELGQIRCKYHHVLHGVCVDEDGDMVHCDRFEIDDRIQFHTEHSPTGVQTYIEGLKPFFTHFETKTRKWERTVFGKKVGGFVSNFASSFFEPKRGAVMHSSCNWTFGVHSDSLMIHDLNPLVLPGWWTARTMFNLQKPLLKKKMIFVPTEAVKSSVMYWLKCDPDEITVAHHGVNHVLFRPTHVEPEYDYLLYAGDYRSYKRVEEGIRCASDLGVHFVRVGPPPSNHYAQSIHDYGRSLLGNKFHDMGYVTKVALRNLYAGAVASWFTSKLEGFGLPALESAACGTVPIVSDTPVMREVHGDCAFYGIPSSLKDLEFSRRDLVQNAKKFTWEKSAKIHEDRWKKEGLI